ncbi:MAG: hypothetical protein DRQ88_01410 [Epsilonproteobacteria bacterium]|nr:MAG: hypothetical protein DRQ89_05480 [Campylobacterota bacterium]RLA67950.1 MAG: hypothetical protein DRQ88_01410 [Campylobacterota bacterium]
MTLRAAFFIIFFITSQKILAEELECEGGSLFEKNRQFNFIKSIESDDYIVLAPNIEGPEENTNDFLVTVDIKNFSIRFLSMADRKTSLAILSYTNGFKVGNISGNYKKYWNFLTCSILD